MPAPALPPRGARGVASTLHAQPLQRWAIVSGRQSPPQPIVAHVESTARP